MMKKTFQYAMIITALLITTACADIDDNPSVDLNPSVDFNIENIDLSEKEHCTIDGVIGTMRYSEEETIREDLTDCRHGLVGYKDKSHRIETSIIGACTNGEYTYIVSTHYGDWSDGQCVSMGGNYK